MAQSAKTNAWEGFYGQVGIGYESFSPSASGGTTTVGALPAPYSAYSGSTISNNNAATTNANGLAGNISAGYNFGINSSYVLGLGVSYYPGASSAGNVNNAATCTTVGNALGCTNGTVSGNYNVKNVYSIFLSPGYSIDKDRLIYAKVGYTGATVYLSSTQTNTNLTGYSLGLGYKQVITGDIYAFVEGNYGSYSSKAVSVSNYPSNNLTTSVNIKGTGMDGLVGVGYRF
jgi:hypothetical protein